LRDKIDNTEEKKYLDELAIWKLKNNVKDHRHLIMKAGKLKGLKFIETVI
jgi:hypothetical protein